MRRKNVIAILCLFAAATLAILLLPAIERRSIYFPTAAYEAVPENFGLQAETLEIPSRDGVRIAGWWIHGAGSMALLYFHGNGGNVSHRLERTKMLVENLGLNVFLVDYRGYGRSSGRPGEAGLYADGEAIYEAAGVRGFSPERIVIFGESLGAAVAIETARRKPARAIILEAPFLSIPKMARTIYPFLPSFLVRTKFDNEAKIGGIGIPKLVVAAEKDDVVPFEQTRRLFEAAVEPKQFFVIRGAAHNNTYIVGGREYLEVWRRFLLGI
jgi:fermentation-respiration switch protein FrsA (DUF1100 family)